MHFVIGHVLSVILDDGHKIQILNAKDLGQKCTECGIRSAVTYDLGQFQSATARLQGVIGSVFCRSNELIVRDCDAFHTALQFENAVR